MKTTRREFLKMAGGFAAWLGLGAPGLTEVKESPKEVEDDVYVGVDSAREGADQTVVELLPGKVHAPELIPVSSGVSVSGFSYITLWVAPTEAEMRFIDSARVDHL